jgi:2-phospho-L-lactate guanylyltransferase
MSVHALVPLKDLVQAKSRLAGVLAPSERRALAQAMAEDVLAVLTTHPGVAAVTLVSDDPGAQLLARSYAAQWWPEATLSARGLNPLVHAATQRLFAAGAQQLMVLHADLPLLSHDDVSVVISSQQALDGLVIGCDRQGRGTNLLAFNRRSVPRFQFGNDSCAAHFDAAQNAGVPVKILQRSGIAIDVDEAPDLDYVMQSLQQYPQGSTARLLYKTELGTRLTLALSTIPGQTRNFNDVNEGKTN